MKVLIYEWKSYMFIKYPPFSDGGYFVILLYYYGKVCEFMSKQLYQSSGSEIKKLPEMKRAMQQDALVLQGVSSRLQIKEEQRRLSKQPEPLKSNSKRLEKPVTNPDFISAPVGIGRMSQSNIKKMKREDFGQRAESIFGDMDKSYVNDDLNFS